MIRHVLTNIEYIASSTDDINILKVSEGAKVYFYDTGEQKVFHDEQWVDDTRSSGSGGGGNGVISNGSITTEMFSADAKAPFSGVADSVSSEGISDATVIGKSVIIAKDAAAIRTLIGAGTSSITIGASASNAKAGNYTPPNATASVAGLVKQAVSQINSEATTIEGLMADFNILLTNLRTAGIIAS